MKKTILIIAAILLSGCAPTTTGKTYNIKEFELVEPIVFVNIPTIGVDTSFTKDYSGRIS